MKNIKNPVDFYRHAVLNHGMGAESVAKKAIESLNQKSKDYRNSTESRMTLFTSEINEYLYPNNSFLTKSVNDAQFAVTGELRQLNDAVAGGAVTKGRFQPLTLANGDNAPTKTVKVRRNTGHTWSPEYFHVDPIAISSELTAEIPYDARQETLRSQATMLNQAVSNYTLVEWAQGEVGVAETIDITTGNDFFVLTTGATRTNGVTGNSANSVKSVAKNDIIALKTRLLKQRVNNMGTLYFLPTIEQYDDIIKIAEFVDYDKTGRTSLLLDGIVGNLMGINILDPRYRDDWNANILYDYDAPVGNDQDFTLVEDTASAAAGMVSAGIAWVDNLVYRAEGNAIVFPWMNSPIYYGDVYGSELRFAAAKKRGDSKGVVMLLENPNTGA